MSELFDSSAGDYRRISAAISFLERNKAAQPTLAEIAGEINLSESHCQRLFKRWAGVSPKQFLQFLTLEHAKELLSDAESILDTSLELGLSGPSRLHDLFVTFDALTPGEYKSLGESLNIFYGEHSTPFGQCFIALTTRGICFLAFLDEGQDPLAELKKSWPQANFLQDNSKTLETVKQIFLPSVKSNKPFNILIKGTNFQINVWRALLRIPAGRVVSYSDVAELIGKPSATRAVASAIAQNPVSYLIPCHRVIRKSGEINQYRWGALRKKALIGWELSNELT